MSERQEHRQRLNARIAYTFGGLQIVSYVLDSDDVRDGNTIKLPREQEKNEWND